MARRTISSDFWTDSKVIDDFTPEDRYFYLYLISNPHTNLCGCYEISMKQIVSETGYSRETADKLICRFEEVHNVIRFSRTTKEILLLNWHRYNWTKSPKFRKPLLAEIGRVKNRLFREYLSRAAEGGNVSDNDIEPSHITTPTTPEDTPCGDQEPQGKNEASECVGAEAMKPSKYSAIISAWNSLSSLGIKSIKCISPEGTRINNLRARYNQYGEEAILEAIDRIWQSDFLQGKNKTGWTITFDWFIKPSNFPKVYEGNYDNSSNRPQDEPTGADAYFAMAMEGRNA